MNVIEFEKELNELFIFCFFICGDFFGLLLMVYNSILFEKWLCINIGCKFL